MKYLILFFVVVLCGYIGWGVSSYYYNRVRFFKSLELLFEKLNLEINFSCAKILEIIKSFQSSNNDLKKINISFCECLEKDIPISNDTLFKGVKLLNEDEKNNILIYFSSLGKFDVLNQTKQLESQKNEIKRLHENAENEAKKFGPLYIKVGVIIGLTIALILL